MADPKPHKCGDRYYLIDKSDFIIEEVRRTGGQIECWRFWGLEWQQASAFDYWQPLKLPFNDVMRHYREVGWLELLVVTGETEENAQLAFREHFGEHNGKNQSSGPERAN